MPIAVKEAKADLVVDNNGSQAELRQRVTRWLIPQIFRKLKLEV